MPSLNTLFASSLLALSFFATSSVAAPTPAADCNGATPVVPLSNGTASLNPPTGTFLAVAIGRGIQNYSCKAVGVKGISIGALANLYDASKVAQKDEASVHTLPPTCVYDPMPTGDARLRTKVANIPIIGYHYFDALGTPTFNLTTLKKTFHGTKTGDILAPTDANKGPAGTGAVDWLQLSPKVNYTVDGISLVYRVVTAGGGAPICTGTAVQTVEYAAEYWFYG